jgi:hypothetical protein
MFDQRGSPRGQISFAGLKGQLDANRCGRDTDARLHMPQAVPLGDGWQQPHNGIRNAYEAIRSVRQASTCAANRAFSSARPWPTFAAAAAAVRADSSASRWGRK